jgi:hypothetical protein
VQAPPLLFSIERHFLPCSGLDAQSIPSLDVNPSSACSYDCFCDSIFWLPSTPPTGTAMMQSDEEPLKTPAINHHPIFKATPQMREIEIVRLYMQRGLEWGLEKKTGKGHCHSTYSFGYTRVRSIYVPLLISGVSMPMIPLASYMSNGTYCGSYDSNGRYMSSCV